MGNILDYAKENVETFSKRPFHEVDSLILSQLSYLDFSKLVSTIQADPVPFATLATDDAVSVLTHHDRVPELDGELVRRVAANPRFQGMRVDGYVNIIDTEAEEQFSAVTFLFDNFSYIAYRGTDSTFVGWKEDFNLAFINPVPSQAAGVAYLDWMAERISGELRVGGHSKGGNIAVYAALFCSSKARERIVEVYSHDGPGFTEGVLQSLEFAGLESRLHKTIPQSSLVGVLLQHQENYRVVRSRRFWIMQHDPFSWQVTDGSFEYLESLSYGAKFLDKNLNAWLSSLSREELFSFADALYKVMCALPGEAFTDAPDKWSEWISETLTGLRELDQDTYVCILHILRSLFTLERVQLALSSFPVEEWVKPEIKLPQPKIRLSVPTVPASNFLRKLPFYSEKE